MADKQAGSAEDPITIKKYANRRLYNTATSSYVTLEHLCQMVKDGVEFVVYDAKTGEDITRPVLTQIIVEEEAKGANLLPIAFLRQLIGFYGDSMQWMVPSYLEQMMGSFANNQERLRKSMQETLGGIFPSGNIEEMGKQNLALFESAMRMFTPFGMEPAKPAGRPGNSEAPKPTDVGPGAPGGGVPGGARGGSGEPEMLAALKQQVDLLQKQIDALSEESKGGKDNQGS